MNRRGFLKLLTAGAAGLLVGEDLERALWTPGATTHVLPPASGWRPGPPFNLFNPPVDVEGISMRLIRTYDVRTDQLVARMDILCGFAMVRPELALRISA